LPLSIIVIDLERDILSEPSYESEVGFRCCFRHWIHRRKKEDLNLVARSQRREKTLSLLEEKREVGRARRIFENISEANAA
jgi:hypothetical protein